MTQLPYQLPMELPGDVSDTPGYTPATSGTGGGDGTLTAIPSFCDDAANLLISEYKGLPYFRAWLCSFLDRLQETDDATAIAYEFALDVDRAEGAQLDLLGAIVVEPRDGQLDDDYRRCIRVKILVNRSQGRIKDFILICRAWIDTELGTVRIREFQPARIQVIVESDGPIDSGRLHTRLVRAKSAGVALQSITNPAGSLSRAFRLTHNGVAQSGETGPNNGLGYTGNPALGGNLAHGLG